MKKVLICSLTAATILAGATVAPVSMFAKSSVNTDSSKRSISEKDLKDIEGVAEYFNLTEEEKVQFTINVIKSQQLSGDFTTQGKLSWAVKALKAGFDKLPAPVKAVLGIEGFLQILGFVDNFTGAIEDGIYQGALTVTGNETTAWWVTKALMLLL